MKSLSLALSFLLGGASALGPKNIKNILSKATPLGRKLEENNQADLSAYSIKFEKCQAVRQWSIEQNQGGNNKNAQGADDILQLNRFAIFKLCPDSSCSSNYGEYIMDLDTYLQEVVAYYQEVQEEMCNACNENCQNDDANNAGRRLEVDCSTCVDECGKIENMEANGYLEASNYIQCNQLDAGDDGGVQYYAAAMCASNGEKIKIGVFEDEQCSTVNNNLYVDDYLGGYKLSHALLKQVYSGAQIPCSSYNENAELEENEACANLWGEAAKCETNNGFAYAYANYDEDGNQVKNEDVVCSFISQMKGGTYDAASGEIVLKGKNSTKGGGSSATGGQKFALTVLVLGTVGLAVYAASLHSQLTKGGKADLSKQGGQMA